MNVNSNGHVLVLFPPRDAEITLDLLHHADLPAVACHSISELCDKAEAGADVLVVTEESIDFGRGERLKKILDRQPAWSDLPVIVLTTRTVSSEVAVLAMERLGNVTLLERPISMKTLISVLRTSIKARRRQYQIRDHLAEKERREEMLSRTNKELEQFAYVSSHDLKEPLRKISMYAQLLHTKAALREDPTLRPWLENIASGADRMNHLIEDLLAYTRIDRHDKEFGRVDMNEAIRSVLSDLETTMRESHAQVSIKSLPIVRGNGSQIRQVLQNLVANAIKFHANSPPQVNVTSAEEAGFARLTVSDNGIGIDPRFTKQIFQVFSRLHNASQYPGTGIGLAICKKIVERHGGRIWVDSTEGNGSAFHFTLPLFARVYELTAVPRVGTHV